MYTCGYQNYADPNSTKIIFNQYSMQWQSIIIVTPIFLMFCIKDLTVFIKCGVVGIIAIISYGIFLIYLFIDNLATGQIRKQSQEGNVKLFTDDFALVVGNLALAFFIHNYMY